MFSAGFEDIKRYVTKKEDKRIDVGLTGNKVIFISVY